MSPEENDGNFGLACRTLEPASGWRYKFTSEEDPDRGGFIVYGELPPFGRFFKRVAIRIEFFNRTYDPGVAKMRSIFFAAGSKAEMLISARLAGIPEDKMLAFARTVREDIEDEDARKISAADLTYVRAAGEILRMAKILAPGGGHG